MEVEVLYGPWWREPLAERQGSGQRRHDGSIITDAVDVLWGTDTTQTIAVADGVAHVFVAFDHGNSECGGIHADKSGNRFQALEPVRQGVRRHFGVIAARKWPPASSCATTMARTTYVR